MLTVNYQANENVVKLVLEGVFTDTKVKVLLDNYFAPFEPEYINVTHKQYVELFITELLSNLDRKSIEPIALHLKGKLITIITLFVFQMVFMSFIPFSYSCTSTSVNSMTATLTLYFFLLVFLFTRNHPFRLLLQ